ncbi:hypothetical protein [Geobacillus sp. TFV-3]|uniref:hypothetical protein n=1 Tax=Geobacillus sp. TFV-3 TaxID=1897059 RepID=UPI001359721A|nr:hypothetical protein [Geobacillus sp. TFV-3]KAF0996627.1 hypothetical protein BJQ97_03317 [Geobacillus sp. TFV-3]
MKKTVIATVGISLLGGLKRHNISFDAPIEEIVKQLYELEDHEKLCAEMSSITSLLREGIVSDPQN